MSHRGQFDNCNWSEPSADFWHPMNSSHPPHNGEFLPQMKWTQSPYKRHAGFINNYRNRHNPYTSINHSRDPYVPDQNWRFSKRTSHRESRHPHVYNYYHNNYSYLAGRDEFCSNRTSRVGSRNISQMQTISNRNGPVPFANETQANYLSNISFRREENSLPKYSSTPVPGTLRNHRPLTPDAQSFGPSVPIRNPCNFPRSSLNISDKRTNDAVLMMPVRPGSEMTKFVENCQEPSSNSSFPVYSLSNRRVKGLHGAPTEQSYIQNKQVLARNHYKTTAPEVNELNRSNTLYIPVKFLVVTNSQKQNGLSLSMAASQGNPQSSSSAPRICLQESHRDSMNGTLSEQRSGQVTSSKTLNATARPVQNWRSNSYDFQTQNSLYSSVPLLQREPRSTWHCSTKYLEDGSQVNSLSQISRPTTDQGIWRTSTSQVNRQVNNGTLSQPHHNGTEISKKADYLTKSIPPNLVQRSNTKVEQPERVEGSCSVFAGRNIAAKIEENPCQSSHRYNSECDPDNFITKTDYFYQEDVQLSTNKCYILGEGILRNEILEKYLSDAVRDAKVEGENFPGDTLFSKFKEVPLERTLGEGLPGNVEDRTSIRDVQQSRDSSSGHQTRGKLEGDYNKKTQDESSRSNKIPEDSTSSSFHVSNLKREDELHHWQDYRKEVAFRTSNENPVVAGNKEAVIDPPCLSTKTTNDVLIKTEILNSPLPCSEDVKCDDVEIDLNDTFTYETAVPSQSMDEKVVIEDFPLQDFELEKCDDIEIVFTKMKKELLPSPKVECKALVEDENTDEGIKPNEPDKSSEPLLHTADTVDMTGEEILSYEDLELASCENIDVEEIEFSDADLRLSPAVEEEVVDRCPKGHFLHPYRATFNLKTGKIVVPCRKCNSIISMKSRINLL